MRQHATYWPFANLTIDHTTGQETLTFSDTPEEFVAKLCEQDIYIYIAKGCCSECFYTPASPIPRDILQKHERTEMQPFHRILECLHNHVARLQNSSHALDMIVCYGYYYQHWYENQYLLAAKEAGRIIFCDISELPNLRGSGLLINKGRFFE